MASKPNIKLIKTEPLINCKIITFISRKEIEEHREKWKNVKSSLKINGELTMTNSELIYARYNKQKHIFPVLTEDWEPVKVKRKREQMGGAGNQGMKNVNRKLKVSIA